MVQSNLISEFSYMIEDMTVDHDEYEVLSASVPAGMAVIDTGCTTSVIGSETADRYRTLWLERGIPEPVAVELPPVQLKGFNGVRSVSAKGLRWTVKLGSLWGQVTTYVVPGSAPFLLSRKVLQGMEASIDLGGSTITSDKHNMSRAPLAQAANGHLLLSLVPDAEGEAAFQVLHSFPNRSPELRNPEKVPAEPPAKKQHSRLSTADLRKHFQTVMKHTRHTQADVGSHVCIHATF